MTKNLRSLGVSPVIRGRRVAWHDGAVPAPAQTLDALLTRRTSPATPLVTFYDDATGERVELSGVTTANWVAKTANFLVDDLDAETGTRVRIGLPTHWLRVVWLLSTWAVGGVVADHDAEVGVSGPALDADEPLRVAASLRPLGARFAEPPTGFLDLGAEVPSHGDVFVPLDPPRADSPALDLGGTTWTHAEWLEACPPEPRRLVLGAADVVDDARRLVSALRGDGSLVLVVNADADAVERIAAQERAVPS